MTNVMIQVLDRKDGNMIGVIPLSEATTRIAEATEIDSGEVMEGLATGQSYRTAGCVYRPIAETLDFDREPIAEGDHRYYEPAERACRDCDGKGFIGGDGFSEDTETCGSCGGCGRVPV